MFVHSAIGILEFGIDQIEHWNDNSWKQDGINPKSNTNKDNLIEGINNLSNILRNKVYPLIEEWTDRSMLIASGVESISGNNNQHNQNLNNDDFKSSQLGERFSY